MRRAALLLVLAPLLACSAERVDTILRNALVHDGTGARARVTDIAIEDGRIVGLGRRMGLSGREEIDLEGLVVAPGFVDIHSHADLILLSENAERLLEAKIRQGVTTLVVGNCGLGPAPADETTAAILAGINGWMTPEGVNPGPLSTRDYLERLERRGTPINVATLVPHGPLRIGAMGLAPGAPDLAAMESMRRTLRDSLHAGAYGLSAGLIYPPGMYSDTEELVALTSVVSEVDGLFTAHVRGSSETLGAATEELVEIARRSGARAHHSHLEAVGRSFWDGIAGVLAIEDAARAAGTHLSHDVFPYTRAATMMAAIFPPWSLEGGVPGLLDRLRDPRTRERIRREIESTVPEWPPWRAGGWPHNLVGAVGWDGISIASVGSNDASGLEGRDLRSIAEATGREPFDVVADLMLEQDGRVGQLVGEISGSEEELDGLLEILAHPAAAVISDAEDYGRGVPHPAHAGAFARALRLNREHELMPDETLVHRMSGYPASIVGIEGVGRIAVDAVADLVVYDPRAIRDEADWQRPRAFATGVEAVMIGGSWVVRDGRYTPGESGRVLRRPVVTREAEPPS